MSNEADLDGEMQERCESCENRLTAVERRVVKIEDRVKTKSKEEEEERNAKAKVPPLPPTARSGGGAGSVPDGS